MQPLSKMWIVISFKLNQNEIVRTMCAQREVTNNTGQGRWYLEKKMNDFDAQDKKQLPTFQKEKIDVLYCLTIQPHKLSKKSVSKDGILPFAKYDEIVKLPCLSDIFHPPRVDFA